MHDQGHGEGGGAPFRSVAQRGGRRLLIVFLLTLVVAIVEIAGGLLTGSIALVADAGHMLMDCAGLGMALGAVWLGGRPASDARSFGYYRAEILAALLNGVFLLAVAGYVLVESGRRFLEPRDVATTGMLAVAVVGLIANGIGLGLLRRDSGASLNMRGAYLEVLSDTIGSVAVIIAGVVIMTTGWLYADPLAGAGIAIVIVPRTLRLLREATHVLIEGTPAHIDARAVEEAMLGLPQVRAVHDLHIWAITSGMELLSAHVVVDDPSCGEDCLVAVERLLRERFGIDHATVQVEGPDFAERVPPF